MHEKMTGAQLPSVMALAYLGDAEHTLYVRRRLVGEGIAKAGELNARALEYVTAVHQAQAMRRIEPSLLEDERDVYKRAFNSPHLKHPKSAGVVEYRAATGFEAVLGMLSWLGDTERIALLLSLAYPEKTEEQDSGQAEQTKRARAARRTDDSIE